VGEKEFIHIVDFLPVFDASITAKFGGFFHRKLATCVLFLKGRRRMRPYPWIQALEVLRGSPCFHLRIELAIGIVLRIFGGLFLRELASCALFPLGESECDSSLRFRRWKC
jgi:hypothetical protein